MQQATNNTKEQFSNSPDLPNGILNAIMDAAAAHSTMSKQALDSEKVRSGLMECSWGLLSCMRHCEQRETLRQVRSKRSSLDSEDTGSWQIAGGGDAGAIFATVRFNLRGKLP